MSRPTTGAARSTSVVVAALAVVGVLAVGLGAPAPLVPTPGALAGTGAPRAGALPLPEPLEPDRLEVIEQTTFVGPGSPFTLALGIDDVSDDATLTLRVHAPVSNRIQLGSTLGGTDLGPVVQEVAPIPVRDLPTEPPPPGDPTGTTQVVRIGFVVPGEDTDPANPFQLRIDGPGVYPLAIQLSDDGDEDRVVTHVVRPADPPTGDDTPAVALSVATLVRLDADVTLDAEGTPDLTPTSAARLASVATALARSSLPATVVTTGAVLDALSIVEPTTPLGDALTGRLLRPAWTPISISDLLASGRRDFLDRQLLAGSEAAGALVGDAADQATGQATDPSVWVLDEGVDAAGLTALTELGVTGVVVPEVLAEPLDTSRFPATLTESFTVADSTGETLPALQTDVVLTTLLNSTDQPALAANRVLADLAVLAFDFPDLQRAAVLDTGPDVDPRSLQLVLEGLAPGVSGPAGTVPLLEPRTVADALAITAAVSGGLARQWETVPPDDLRAWSDRLTTVDAGSAALASTLIPASPDTRAAQILTTVNRLTLASGAAGRTANERNQLLADAEAQIDDALAAIGIPPQGTVTLTSDTGVVPVTLQNGLPDPVAVRLTVVSDKLDFPDGATLELTLDPGTNRREVAVRTRATGSFPVELDLRTADGRLDIATGRLSVRSTAFSGLGLVLAIIAGVFLALWWAKHLRSARRSRRLVGAGDSAGEADDGEAGDRGADG